MINENWNLDFPVTHMLLIQRNRKSGDVRTMGGDLPGYSISLINRCREGGKMASDKSFIEFIVDQMGNAGFISHKKMFGEHAIYCDAKVVALVCDNQLFVKPTEGGRAYIGNIVEAAPYPGAKLWFLIVDAFEDREWISGLIKITVQELQIPKQKRNKTRHSDPERNCANRIKGSD